MLVKALCTIKDGTGTHSAGEIFETDEELGNLVTILEKKEEKPEASVETPQPVPEESPKPRSSRKKKAE